MNSPERTFELKDYIADAANIRAVFDLDSTIFCTSFRTQAIFKLFIQTHREIHPEFVQQLEQVKTDPKDWGIRTALVRHRVQAPTELFKKLRDFWVEHFFSNQLLSVDQPYDGAIDFVLSLAAAGAEIYYLTGRDEVRMGQGTRLSLRQYKLPLDEQNLLMKPQSGVIEDVPHKLNHLSELVKTPRRIVFFENEPLIINAVARELPKVELVWMDTTHSQQAAVLAGIQSISTFS